MLEYDNSYSEWTSHPIIQRHKAMLQKMANKRVVGIVYDDGEFGMLECCDGYFYYGLTEQECLELSELFKEIAEEYKKE